MTTTELAKFIVSNHDNVINVLNRCTSGNFAHTIANIKNIMCAYNQFAKESLEKDCPNG